jgi:Domain of unknown function (DUF4145)
MTTPESQAPVKGHCPHCGPNRHADVVGYHERDTTDDLAPVWATTEYRILQCRGCECVYFQTDETFSEDIGAQYNPATGEMEEYLRHKITHWPAPVQREQPNWSSELMGVDPDLYSLFDDIYIALNQELNVLSAIGIRTIFDRASELLGVHPAKTFKEKLTNLVDLGKVGVSERNSLDILTNAGSAAAHRGWRPDSTQLSTMLNVIEAFLYRNFVLDAEIRKLKTQVPEKPKHKTALP